MLEKKCPNCGKELPEEASFCLFCFTDINNYKKENKVEKTEEVEENKTEE